MKTMLKGIFLLIFTVMLLSTLQASMDRGIVTAFGELWPDPWFRVTLYDAYFAFFSFYLWVAFRERTAAARALWFVLIMVLGNLAISCYMLIQLFRLKKEEPVKSIFLKS